MTKQQQRAENEIHENSVPDHFRTGFDLGTLEGVGDVLLRMDVLDLLPQQEEVRDDLHLRPSDGDEDGTNGLSLESEV